jgi:F-type H+-transporting ATPase subunit b
MLIDWFTVIAQVVNFLILVWLLKRFLYKPILRAIDAREKHLSEQSKLAEEKKTEATKQLNAYQQLNQELLQNKEELLQSAKADVKVAQERMLEDARNEYVALRARLQESLRHEQEQMHAEMQQRTESEVFAIARKLLTDLASATLEQQMTEIFCAKLASLPSEAKSKLRMSLGPGSVSQPVLRTGFALSTDQQHAITMQVRAILETEGNLDFQMRSELICGIELSTDAFKLSWSVADYLETFQKNLTLFAKAQDGADSQTSISANEHTIPKAENPT